MRFEEIDDAACLRDLQHKIGQRTRLVLMPACTVEDFARGKFHFDLITLANACHGLGTFKDRQSDIDGVTKKNTGVGARDDADSTGALDGDRRMFARGTTTKVLPADDHVPWLDGPGIF